VGGGRPAGSGCLDRPARSHVLRGADRAGGRGQSWRGSGPIRSAPRADWAGARTAASPRAGRRSGPLLMDQSGARRRRERLPAELLFRHRVSPFLARPLDGRRALGRMWADLVTLMRSGVRMGRIVTTRPEDRSRRRGAVQRDERTTCTGAPVCPAGSAVRRCTRRSWWAGTSTGARTARRSDQEVRDDFPFGPTAHRTRVTSPPMNSVLRSLPAIVPDGGGRGAARSRNGVRGARPRRLRRLLPAVRLVAPPRPRLRGDRHQRLGSPPARIPAWRSSSPGRGGPPAPTPINPGRSST
jgi:hypothetical protein